jgi:ribonuclease HI
MSRYHRQTNPKNKDLRVFQANVGKLSPAHDCALALADAERYDIVLLQEPWTGFKHSRCLTKTHPAYDAFSPVDSWDSTATRPRVMTYVRRNPRLIADQKRPARTRDILWLKVNNTTIINFYRQPSYDEALNILLDWPIPPKCLIAGDFNAIHNTWQTGRQISGRGEAIATWAADNSLDLLNTIDIPTNPHGNTIDLAYTNIALAEATIEDHLATSSDHFTISITLPALSPAVSKPQKFRLTTEEEIKRFTELVEVGAKALPSGIGSTAELDALAASLIHTLQTAARAAGRPVRKCARSASWWNEDCASAAAEYHAMRRLLPLGFNEEIQLARRAFQRVVRYAKKQYWKNLIDGFTDRQSIFKAVRWIKSPGAFQPPPLQVGDAVYETQTEKANALRQTTLERRTADDDIPDPWIPVTPTKSIPFSTKVSLEEARYATTCIGNTSPGADNITVRMLQATWHIIGPHVRQMYEGCLTLGHYPRAFKEAEVVMIPKPGRRDLSTPRAWRPISLLSCIGKGLERLVSRRLAWAAIHYGVIHPQQAGALPKRSAVDLVAALIHDIEESLARGQVATLVTIDIQGAFDAVLRNRLTLRLREQGWPSHLALWVESFMSNRSASIRYQDITTPAAPLSCGLPQGSPCSPLLFLLYTEPIYRLGNQKGRFGYADDTAILCTGHSLKRTAKETTKCIQDLVEWGRTNAITFDPAKTEIMHFTQRTTRRNPPIFHEGVRKQAGLAMRWLGIWLDRKLTFKTHVEKWAAKAQAIAYHLKSLANTTRGPLPHAVHRAVTACIVPTLLYGAEAWYPGMTMPEKNHRDRERPTRIQHLMKKMDKAIRQSIRTILPVWKTTPTPILHRESGIPPMSQLLEAVRYRFSARLKSLDDKHPLAVRTAPPPSVIIHKLIKRRYQLAPVPFQTRLRRTDQLLARCPRPQLIRRRFSDNTLQLASKEESAKAFHKWLRMLPPQTILVYSDGSLSPEGAAGYGYTVHQTGQSISNGSGRLGPAEVFDAEATGALEGLKTALVLPQASKESIVVCLDNLAAASCLIGTPSESSQAVFLEFQSIANSHGKVSVRWIPGHAGILGNEQADALAKAGCMKPEPANALPTLAFLRRTARKQPRDAFDAWWAQTEPERYKPLGLKVTTRCPPELRLRRPILHHLLAARSHHGDFAAYHERFKHADARLTCSCGRRKAPTHIFYCRRLPPRHRMRLTPSPTAAVNQAIGKNFDKFSGMAEAFFGKVCPRH